MAINLKEIFDYDSDQIKLDKVNYNFDQIVANGGGPQGPAGQVGPSGSQGTIGEQGPQGPQGSQGFQGPSGSDGGEYWHTISGSTQGLTSDTLVPEYDPATGFLEAPNVVIGYRSDEPEYNQPEEEAKLVVHRHNNYESNIRLKTNGVPNSFNFRLEDISGVATASYFFTGGGPNLLAQYADRINLKSANGQIDFASFDGSNFIVNVEADLQDTTVNGTLRIASGNPGVDKIAVASDTQGTIEFKSINEIGGTVPVGTIISILPSIFDDNTKFLNQESITLLDDDNDILPIRVGAGVGDYKGWYICNGKTWKDVNGFTFQTPDLNSFSYTIDDNPNSTTSNSQGAAAITNHNTQIIGGADVSMQADWLGSSYDITGSVDTAHVTIEDGSGNDTVYIKKLPQIIYIGEEDLYWEDGGSGQAPLVTTKLNFFNAAAVGTSDPTTQTFNDTDNQGEVSILEVDLMAPNNQKWTSVPSFGDPNSSNYPNISSIPSTPAINISNNQQLDVYVMIEADGNIHQFNYDTTGHITPNNAIFNLNADNGVTITNPNLTVASNNGQSALLGTVTFNAPNNKQFGAVSDVIAPVGYTLSNASFGSNGTDASIITADLYVDSFDGNVGSNIPVSFTTNLQEDLTNTQITNVIVGLTGSGQNQINASWNSVAFNSSTMDYYVQYQITTSPVTPAENDSGWTPGAPGINRGNNVTWTSSSLNILSGYYAHVKVQIVETGNTSNIGGIGYGNVEKP